MAITKTINLEVNTKDAQKSLKGLEKGVEDVNKEVKDTSKITQQMGGTLDKVTGGAVSKFGAFKSAVAGVTTGFKSLRVAIIATGIGALLIAVTALGQAFTRSEEGQNKFAKILGVIGSVTGNLLDLLADLGESIISVFENPKQALIDFKNAFIENITNRFTSALDTVGFLGKAIKKVFSGDFKGALEDAKSAGSSYIDSLTGVKNTIDKTTESVKSFNKEIVDDAKAAAKIADQRAKAEKAARNLLTERAQAEQDIARLREKAADKENFTAKERIEFLKQAGDISEDLAAKETEVARLKLEAKQTENSLTKSTKQDLDEEAQLKADLINKETQRLKLQKALTAEITTATREATADQKTAAAERKKTDDAKIAEEKARLDAIGKIQEDFKKKQQDADAETELQKIALEQERKLAELDRLKATEKQKAEVIAFYQNKIQDVKDKNAKQDEELGKLRTQQALGDAQNTFNQIAQLAGKDSKVGKAMAIASATISGVQGVMNAYTTAQKSPITVGFPAYPVVQASLAGLVAAKNIAAIKSINPSGGGGGSIPTQSSGGGSTPPAFNIVGSSGETQLADAIGSQTQRPSRAYVVSNDVTTAQEMDRNIIEGASI